MQTRHKVIFTGLPIPPTDNNIYANAPGRGRYPTKDAKEFVKAFGRWQLLYTCGQNSLFKIKSILPQRDERITYSQILHGHRSRLLTKDGRTKKFDAHNRIKLMADCVAEALMIDDSDFWLASAGKMECPDDIPESVTVELIYFRQDRQEEKNADQVLVGKDGTRSDVVVLRGPRG